MFARSVAWLGLAAVLFLSLPAAAQMAGLRPASEVQMPAPVDSNSPAFWHSGQFRIFNSTGSTVVSAGRDQFTPDISHQVVIDRQDHFPMWIEAAWRAPDGTVYAWYHHEPGGICNGQLTAPVIGALVSYDGGASFTDLGFVLTSGAAPDCSAQNGFFAGGHGDFSVVFDPITQYFYFLFDNYGGPTAEQGVAVARMAYEDREQPGATVWKYFHGDWNEPGRGGHMSPVFPARVGWAQANTDSFWGPSLHWNTYLESWVVFMSRSCCRPMWPQEGVYISFNPDLGDPRGWTSPERILEKPGAYYPQVLGTTPGETDSVAGETARLYLRGVSRWEIVFLRTDPESPDFAALETRLRR